MNSVFEKFDPAVDRKFLVLLSGIVWNIVGVMLCRLAFHWLYDSAVEDAAWLIGAGILLALLIHHFLFLRLVHKNTDRIFSGKGKMCIFSFQPLKSYLIVFLMIGMGIFLRLSAIPKPYLAVIYIGFGGAMILSSLKYYWVFLKNLRH